MIERKRVLFVACTCNLSKFNYCLFNSLFDGFLEMSWHCNVKIQLMQELSLLYSHFCS